MSSATENSEPTRRDFIFIATGAMAAVGVAATLWPFVAQMKNVCCVRSLASEELRVRLNANR